MTSDSPQSRNRLHGVTLAAIVEHLVETYGWEDLGRRISIRCFQVDPSVKSSLKFLRKTPWAREKVEGLYLYSLRRKHKKWGGPAVTDTPTDSETQTDSEAEPSSAPEQPSDADNVWLRNRKT